MEDGSNIREAGIASTQIEASRRKLSIGVLSGQRQESDISSMDERITGGLAVIFLLFLFAFIFFGIDTYVVRGVILILAVIIAYRIAMIIRKRRRTKIKQAEDFENYSRQENT